MSYFILYAETCIEEYAEPSDEIDVLLKSCISSEFQYLNHDALSVEISEESGLIFPDLILAKGAIPLISDRMKRCFDEQNVDNLFYKRITLTCNDLGKKEYYWLALPPRINCLDFGWLDGAGYITNENQDLPLWQWSREVKEIRIISANVGRYKIFKLSGVINQEIVITKNLKDALEKEKFENVYFQEIKEE